jgi:hypothetical protein
MANCPDGNTYVHNDYIFEYDPTSDPNYVYYGIAKVHSLTSEPAWRIERITKGSANISGRLAGCGREDQVWDDRLTLTYT